MKHVTILALRHTIATTVFGPMDVFSQAGSLWNAIREKPPTPYFKAEIATRDGQPVDALNHVRITPHKSIRDIGKTDLILVPSIVVAPGFETHFSWLIDWLGRRHKEGSALASVCTGAFVLAATGLLNGRTATTHWGFQEMFRRMYPKVDLRPERLITDEGSLFCAGALGAGIDLSIHLVEKYCGRPVALQCAKSLVHDMGRNLQSPYQVFRFHTNHSDKQIKTVQKWIEEHFSAPLRINVLSREHGMSRRNFERRFKKATGDTPLNYLQRIRVERAKRFLEAGQGSFGDICRRVGYEDGSHFRAVFKKYTGLLPAQYQKKFSGT